MRALVLLTILCLAVPACTDDLDSISLVSRLRVLGAQTQVVGDTERANPRAGEELEVRFVLSTLGARGDVSWRFIACVPAPTLFGVPFCGEFLQDPNFMGEPCDGCSGASATDDPVMRFEVPNPARLGDAQELLVIGALCSRGTAPALEELVPRLVSENPVLSGCSDAEDPNQDDNNVDEDSVVTFVTIPLLPGDEVNNNPRGFDPTDASATELRILLEPPDPDREQPGGGAAPMLPTTEAALVWPADEVAPRDAPETGCNEEPLNGLLQQRSVADGILRMTVQLNADSLERFIEDGEPQLEELQISWRSTGAAMTNGNSGEFENPFTFISETGDNGFVQSAQLWRPPVPADNGTLVRFHFVVRDGRGGTVWAERALCITK